MVRTARPVVTASLKISGENSSSLALWAVQTYAQLAVMPGQQTHPLCSHLVGALRMCSGLPQARREMRAQKQDAQAAPQQTRQDAHTAGQSRQVLPWLVATGVPGSLLPLGRVVCCAPPDSDGRVRRCLWDGLVW